MPYQYMDYCYKTNLSSAGVKVTRCAELKVHFARIKSTRPLHAIPAVQSAALER